MSFVMIFYPILDYTVITKVDLTKISIFIKVLILFVQFIKSRTSRLLSQNVTNQTPKFSVKLILFL